MIQIITLAAALALMGKFIFKIWVHGYKGYHTLAFWSCIIIAMLNFAFTSEIPLVWVWFSVGMVAIAMFSTHDKNYRSAMLAVFPVAIVTTLFATVAFVSGL